MPAPIHQYYYFLKKNIHSYNCAAVNDFIIKYIRDLFQQMATFVKVSGLGNDYVVFDCRQGRCPSVSILLRYRHRNVWKAFVAEISQRRTSIGSDGVIVIGKSEHPNGASCRMRIFNSDGSEAELCCNGLRCIAKYLSQESNDALPFEALVETGMRRRTLRKVVVQATGLVRANLGKVVHWEQHVVVARFATSRSMHEVNVGNPHLVYFLRDDETLAECDLEEFAADKQSDYENGINVSFVKRIDPATVKARTYERGSGETNACGSAAAAIAVGCWLQPWEDPPEHIDVSVLYRGGKIHMSWQPPHGDLVQTGQASILFSGVVNVPKPPQLEQFAYKLPPSLNASRFAFLPKIKFNLSNLPTPLEKFDVFKAAAPFLGASMLAADKRFECWIKRDDLTGAALSGNKIRKLDFCLADAVERNCDVVITCGGIQSNHCRATAVACARIKSWIKPQELKAHLILRVPDNILEGGATPDVGFSGNLLLARFAGAQIHLVSETEYHKEGGFELVKRLAQRLIKEGVAKKPCCLPSGASNALGSFGYIHCAAEVHHQCLDLGISFDAAYVACGSVGTAVGFALGVDSLEGRRLGVAGGSKTCVHAVSVCDPVEDAIDDGNSILDDLIKSDKIVADDILTSITDAIGVGYAKSTPEELQLLHAVALETGIFLDPVYSGKALYDTLKQLGAEASNGSKQGEKKRVLFVHTGGIFGLYGADTRGFAALELGSVERFREY